MLPNNQPMMTFALAADERMVHVDDVPTGLSCECICPGCHSRLIAKNAGREKTHHFAHEAGNHQQGCAETALHRAAKQVIQVFQRVTVPALPPSIPDQVELALRFVELEYRLSTETGNIVADCYAETAYGHMAIEIAVYHQADEIKATKLRELGLPTLEIDLSDMVALPWDWNELEDAVLFKMWRRKWIEQPEFIEQESKKTAQHSLSNKPPQVEEWRFAVGNVWILVKRLRPFGNYKVYHPFNEQARQIVEPICRHRGYWQPDRKNWIVRDEYGDFLLHELSLKARLL